MSKINLLVTCLATVLFISGLTLFYALIGDLSLKAQIILAAIGTGVGLGYCLWRINSKLEQAAEQETAVLRAENSLLRQKVTSLQQVSSVLREQKAHYQDLFEYASDIVYILNLDGVILFVNRAIEEIIGYLPTDVVGRHFVEFTEGLDEQVLWERLNHGGISSHELTLKSRDGRLAVLELSGHLMYQNGRPVAILGIARNISARKREQFELKQAKEAAERATQAKTIFMSNMGHELRTPLSVIIGYADIIGQDARTEGHIEYEALSGKIKYAAQQLGAIVNDVMEITEIEIGQVSYLLEWFNVSDVVRWAMNWVQTAVDANNNTFLLLLPPDAGTMFADRDKVQRILVNLLSNAAKFTHKGTITLSVTREQTPQQEWLVFQVTDTGIGIATERQEAIFEAFYQGDSSFTRAYGGMGLGLAINQHYCRAMHGDITLNSRPGEGSTFILRLPAQITAVTSMFVRKE